IVDGPGERLDVCRLLDDADVVAQPLYQRAGDGDRAFQRVHRRLVTGLVGQGGQQATIRLDCLGAGVQQHEAAGAVGVLGLAGAVAGLPVERRLLVAQVTGDGDAPADGAFGQRRTVGLGVTRGTDR